MRPLSRILVPALALAAACAPAAGAGPATDGPAPDGRVANRRVDLNTIAREEIGETHAGNAYDLIRVRRPMWLSAGSATASRNPGGSPVVVYVNTSRMGGPDALRTISAADVGSIRYYDPAAANIQFGNGHLSGAIQVLPVGSIATHP